MSDFDEQGCGQLTITTTLHPLTEALVDAYISEGWGIMPPQIRRAYDNRLKAGINQGFPAFDTDENGQYQNDELIGKRIISATGGNMPMDVIGGGLINIAPQITLDHTTGTVTSIYPEQTHVMTIGYYITGLPDLMP